MHFSGNHFGRHGPHAHLRNTLSQVVQHALAISLLEVVLPLVGVLLTFGEQRVDQPHKLARSRRHSLGFIAPMLGAHASLQQTPKPLHGFGTLAARGAAEL